ncbi:uncharacterized protein LOC144066091 [Stigmatopora argus]
MQATRVRFSLTAAFTNINARVAKNCRPLSLNGSFASLHAGKPNSHVEKEVSKYFKYFKSTSKILNGLLSSHRLQSATSKMSDPAVGFHPRRRPLVSSCPPEGAAAQDSFQ